MSSKFVLKQSYGAVLIKVKNRYLQYHVLYQEAHITQMLQQKVLVEDYFTKYYKTGLTQRRHTHSFRQAQEFLPQDILMTLQVVQLEASLIIKNKQSCMHFIRWIRSTQRTLLGLFHYRYFNGDVQLITGLSFPKLMCSVLITHVIGRTISSRGTGSEYELQTVIGHSLIALSTSALIFLSFLGGIKVLNNGMSLSPVYLVKRLFKRSKP